MFAPPSPPSRRMALRKFIRQTPSLFRLSRKNALVELTVESIPTIDEIQVCPVESLVTCSVACFLEELAFMSRLHRLQSSLGAVAINCEGRMKSPRDHVPFGERPPGSTPALRTPRFLSGAVR